MSCKLFENLSRLFKCNKLSKNNLTNELIDGISFREILEVLERYEYAIAKVDVPYMPSDFPTHSPIGKDVDILCNEQDAKMAKSAIMEICRKYKDYDFSMTDEDTCYRIRLKRKNQLIFMVDVAWAMEGLKPGFVQAALKSRKRNGEYFVLDEKFEFVCRLESYRKKPNKKYHLEWLKNHIRAYDTLLIDRYCKKTCSIESIMNDD